MNYGEKAKRDIARVMTGVDPGETTHPQPPFLLMAPFLNGMGLVIFLLGSIIAFSRSSGGTSNPQLEPGFDADKWNALIKYDPDIKRIVEALSPYGPMYVEQFAKAFMPLNDKNYLPQIIQDILATAKADRDKGLAE
jgi:hypothetical protein